MTKQLGSQLVVVNSQNRRPQWAISVPYSTNRIDVCIGDRVEIFHHSYSKALFHVEHEVQSGRDS